MDFDHNFIDKLLPHVKSFSYTWFHLQAAKRKHFKNEDKRMNYDDELRLKNQFMNESPMVKLKWAIRLLMKLRKDIQKSNQKDMIEIITSSKSANDPTQCVLSNPDMKGKMRRIDCLRQSDKVWRLDLVMVVLFKGIPLESSDGERIDKLPECKYQNLCVNPNHAFLNVRDLEIFLANYINNCNNNNNTIVNSNQSNVLGDAKLYCGRSILSRSVFTPQEFLTLTEISIVHGASEAEIKTSLVTTGSSSINTHYGSDNDNEDGNESIIHQQPQIDDKSLIKNVIQSSVSSQALNSSGLLDSDTSQPTNKRPKKPKQAKINETLNQDSPKSKSNQKINELIVNLEKQQKSDIKPDFDIKVDLSVKKPSLKRRRSSNLMKTNEQVPVLDENAITDPSDAPEPLNQVIAPTQLISTEDQSSQSSQQDDEIRELLKTRNKNSKNLAHELKDLIQNDQKDKADLFLKKLLNNSSQHQSSDAINSINLNDTHAIKAATPVFELLMSPLFNSILPNSNSNSSSSTSSSNSINSTNGQQHVRTTFNNTLFIQNQNKSKSPPVSKKAKLDNKKHKNVSNQATNQINTSLINALKFDSNLNASFDELLNNLTQHTNSANTQTELTQQQQQFINKLISLSPTFQFVNKSKSRVQTPSQTEEETEKETSSSPPPPPSIGATVNPNSITIAPSPTKLLVQSNNSIQIMHRPIPILQKADAVVSTLINNLNKEQNTNTQVQINSPIMFNNNSLFSSNSNFFSNYPNISPAMNGSGSPTSNLFPSITSLFQSPIGTPRVTPTPQQFAAYFLSDDQYHSLIFPNGNSDDQTNILNFYQSNTGHLSPLIFNNIINPVSQNETTTGNNQSTNSNQKSNLVVTSTNN
ncbi:unnamed protein product [Brachionus calyciflorus]|uniref:CTF/NF-I domain-containing protein n=1 Tax=Brachionus calyciflorus TaxID=104777 RepID=A0A813XI54_9BILA|nr:unnamed protein product [Brachionus calyciflorus]